LAVADVPEDPAARKGHAVAERLGCFRCHGPGGRGAGSNPGSLKGYIPPWDGRDFAELVVDKRELREWILGGRPQRLQMNAVARFFLDRQAIRMPAFRGQITEEELLALVKSWMGRMSLTTGGKTYQLVTEQARRISACRLTFFADRESGAEARAPADEDHDGIGHGG